MATGTGIPILQIVSDTTTYNLIFYKWDNLSFSATINSEVDFAPLTKITFKRGLNISETDYLVTTAIFFIETCTRKDGLTFITANALPNAPVKIATGLTAYDIFVEALTPYSTTVTYDPDMTTWADTWLILERDTYFNSIKELEQFLIRKLRGNVFARSTGIFLSHSFYRTETEEAASAITLPERRSLFTPVHKHRAIYAYNTERVYFLEYYPLPIPENIAIENIGYHSAPQATDTLGKDEGGHFSYEQYPNLALEQGEKVTVNGYSSILFLSFIEEFNNSKSPTWKQTIKDFQWQEGNPDVPPNDGLIYAKQNKGWSVISVPVTTAANDVQVGSGAGEWIKQTLAEFSTIIQTSLNSVYLTLSSMSAANATDLTDGGQTTLHTHEPQINGDEATLKTRRDNGFPINQGFDDTTIPTGYAWAGAPFGTPATVDFTTYASIMRLSHSAALRAFLYSSTIPSVSIYCICGWITGGASSFIGFRADDGSDNNYFEWLLSGDLKGTIRTRVGGGAVATVQGSALPIPMLYGIRAYKNGTLHSSWGAHTYLTIPWQGAPVQALQASSATSTASWTPTRFGILFDIPAANYVGVIDAILGS